MIEYSKRHFMPIPAITNVYVLEWLMLSRLDMVKGYVAFKGINVGESGVQMATRQVKHGVERS